MPRTVLPSAGTHSAGGERRTMANHQQEGPASETPPTDPGCLPAWNVDDLPDPKPITKKNLLGLIGPGLVLAGGSIGTGELIMGPQVAARYHGALMWIALLSVLAQVVLNTEVMRYTLCTGEPVMSGYFRSKPGPRFWLFFYVLLDFAGWLPTLASLSAEVLVVAVRGLGPMDSVPPDTVRMVSYFVFLGCASLSLFGGKIFNTLQVVIGGKVIFVLIYMLFTTIFFVSAKTWGDIWGGLFDFTRVPRDSAGNVSIDWGIVAALAGFSGVGGLGNIMASNYVREKGWGMGAKVGAIPSAFGGHKVELSHVGTMLRDTPANRDRFRRWCQYLMVDQYGVWAAASLVAIMLPCLLGAQYLQLDSVDAPTGGNWRWAAALAQDFGAAKGPIFRTLTLVVALVILIPGQFYVIDSTARRWTDAIWSGSRRARLLDQKRIAHLYYTLAAIYVGWGMCVFTFFPKLSGSTMMIIGANLANLAIATTVLHTWYVNRRFLPASVRPSVGKQIAMAASAAFFLIMFGLVVWQKIVPEIQKLIGG